MEAANDEETITLMKDLPLSSQLSISKAITIKGNTGTETITSSVSDKVSILPKNTITLQNLIINRNGITDKAYAVIEVGSSSTAGSEYTAKLTLKDVTFQNCTNTAGTQGIVQLKGNGNLTLDGVKMTSCSVKDGYGCIFVGNNKLILIGDNSTCSIYNEKSYSVDASAATHTTAIPMTLGTVNENQTVIKGNTNQSLFSLTNDGYGWVTYGSNLQVGSKSVTYSMDSYRYGTLVLPFDAAIPENMKAYRLYLNNADNKIWKESLDEIKANKPVFIDAAEGDYTFTAKF